MAADAYHKHKNLLRTGNGNFAQNISEKPSPFKFTLSLSYVSVTDVELYQKQPVVFCMDFMGIYLIQCK